MPRRRKIDWPQVATALAEAVPLARFDPAVRHWLEQAPGSRWHVALSGGADSVVLLLLLWAHFPERRRRIVALHFDHRLRGPAVSRVEVAFCRELSDGLNVGLVVERWRRKDSGDQVSEAQARMARMAFFDEHARVLWLGHHQDDVAETMLMRLARGSGTGGLSAPRPVQQWTPRRVWLRPLLGIRKSEVADQLRQAGGSWREDETNAGGRYFRNRVRRDVLPAWEVAADRDAVAGAARSRELLAEDDAALEAWIDALAPFAKTGELLVETLAGKPRAIIRRALHRWLLSCRPRIDISRQAFETLLEAVVRGAPTRHSLGPKQFAVLRKGRLFCELGKPRVKFRRRVN